MAVFSVPIQLDKKRNLKYGIEAMMKLEELYPGKGFMDIIGLLQEKPTITLIVNVLCAGLSHEDDTLTPKKLAKILDDADIEDLIGIINKAIMGATPEPNNEKNG